MTNTPTTNSAAGSPAVLSVVCAVPVVSNTPAPSVGKVGGALPG